jgi:hypothetical protein
MITEHVSGGKGFSARKDPPDALDRRRATVPEEPDSYDFIYSVTTLFTLNTWKMPDALLAKT